MGRDPITLHRRTAGLACHRPDGMNSSRRRGRQSAASGHEPEPPSASADAQWGWSACSAANVASTPSLSVAPLMAPLNADGNDCAHAAFSRLRFRRGGLCLELLGGPLGVRCRLLGLVQLLGRLLRRLTRVLLRGPELSSQIVIGRLRGRNGRSAGLVGLVDLFLLGGDLGVGVVEIRVETDDSSPGTMMSCALRSPTTGSAATSRRLDPREPASRTCANGSPSSAAR